MTKKKDKNKKLFFIFLVLTILNYFIPDPIPILDELILTGLSIYYGVKLK